MALSFSTNTSQVNFGNAVPLNNLNLFTIWLWMQVLTPPSAGVTYDICSKGAAKRVEMFGEGGGVGISRIQFTVTRSGANHTPFVDVLDSDLAAGIFLCCSFQNVSSTENLARVFWSTRTGSMRASGFSSGTGSPTSDASNNLVFGRRVGIPPFMEVSYLGLANTFFVSTGQAEKLRHFPMVPPPGILILADGMRNNPVVNRSGKIPTVGTPSETGISSAPTSQWPLPGLGALRRSLARSGTGGGGGGGGGGAPARRRVGILTSR